MDHPTVTIPFRVRLTPAVNMQLSRLAALGEITTAAFVARALGSLIERECPDAPPSHYTVEMARSHTDARSVRA